MKKLVGYVLAIAGLVVMALSFGLFNVDLPLLNTLKPIYITGLGVVLIVVGAGIVMMLEKGKGGKIKQESEEVPIYEGTGKNRKIVGYRRS